MAFTNTGVDVGSMESLDQYAGYGTAFKNPDEFKLDLSERIHMLGATMSPFLSWLQKVRTKTATQVMYTWIESELFTQRDIKCQLIRSAAHGSGGYAWALKLDTGADWMAFSAAAKADSWVAGEEKPLIFLQIIKASDTTKKYAAVIEKNAMYLGQTIRDIVFDADDTDTSMTGVLNFITVYDTGNGSTAIGGAAGELSAVPANMGLQESFANFGTDFAADATDVYVSVSTPNDFLKGYAQGSGLPSESRRTTRSLRNYTQIFKTPYSVAGTLQAISAAGGTYGGDELARKRLEKAIEHKIDIETAILFQAGGEEGVDWGELPASGGVTTVENPLTRFKGLGVGLGVNGLTAKPGFIQSKNADLDSRYVFDSANADIDELNRLMSLIFDDNIDMPSSTKTLFCSQKWLSTLASLGLKQGASQFVFGQRIAAPGELGILVNTIRTPVGNLDCVHLPRLRGKYEDYGVVMDFNHMEYRPLIGRGTMLETDVGEKYLDGQLDFYQTEGGFELRHESAHAVIKL